MTTIDLTTLNPTDPMLAANALAGPWQAVLYDGNGEVIPADQLTQYGAEDVYIEIVRRSAVPVMEDGVLRMTGCTDVLHRIEVTVELVDFSDDLNADRLHARWVQAQAMAAGLNAAAKETGR